MRIFRRFTGIILIMIMSLASFACQENTTIITTEDETTSIVGEYIIDITDLGMPLQFYLKIDSEDNFFLAPDRTYVTDKGHGTIGSSGDIFMLIYSDSTTEEPKTSTFTVVEGNLSFQTNLPYGTSNLPASKVDEDNPDITYYLVGKVLKYEDYFGEYAGSHTVEAMGSAVEYEYYLTLEAGREFTFVSDYSMGSTPYQYTESGHYDVEEGELTLHLGTETVIGQFDTQMNLTLPVKPSEMANREERLLRVATTAACASIYHGYYASYTGETLDYEVDLTVVLDKFGGYTLTAENSVSGTLSETGSFTLDGKDLEFSPATSEDTFTGEVQNYVLQGEFLVATGDSRQQVTLYCETVQGLFSATGEDEAENTYTAELELNPDGSFTFVVEDGEQTAIIDEAGTFAITKMMFTQLVLTATSENTYTLVVSEVGLNINVTLADETEIGFSLKKAE